MGLTNKIRILESEYKDNPTFEIYISCETEMFDINITELNEDILSFKEYLIQRYYKKNDNKKAWYKFWKK